MLTAIMVSVTRQPRVKEHTDGTTDMTAHWILLANARYARLLRQEHGAPLDVLATFTHSDGSGGTAQRGRGGYVKEDGSFGGITSPPRMDARHKVQHRLAHELAGHLERQAQSGRFDSLVVFASNPFLGELKAQLGVATRRRLRAVCDVDLTSVGPAELEPRIAHEIARDQVG
jgi:hypothetical protein